MAQSPEYPDLRWIPPRSFSRGRPTGQPTKICVHYTAGSERSTSAEDGALYDQRRTDGTSSGYYADSNSVVHCVRTTDRSHTALRHGNDDAIHYELCGTAQTRAQWLDAASRPTLRNAARQMVRDMRKYGIPLKRLVGRQVRDRSAKGICGHVDFTTGWPEDGGTHTDPGPQFPWDVLFADITAALGGDTEEDDMFTEADRNLLREAAYGGANAARRADAGVQAVLTELRALIADDAADDAVYLARLDEIEARLVDVGEDVAALPGADPAAWAEQVAQLIIPRLPQDNPGAYVDALRDRLAE